MDTFVPDEPEKRHSVPSGTVTFLFTDIEGSTQLLQSLREGYATLLEDHHAIMRATLAKWHGREIDTQGDAFFVSFARATQAVNCVVEMQRSLAGKTWPGGVEVRVRMGLHTGEPLVAVEGYVGMDVHRAARIAHVGHGGQVLLSETTTALVLDELPESVSLLDMGRHLLKDLRRPEHIRQLVIQGLPSEFPPLTSLEALPPVELRQPRQVGECPYRGLAAFQEADAKFFHGREAFTERLYEAVKTQPLVAVIVGSSGSGKSSVVFAGLLPRLSQSCGWLTVQLRPGSQPYYALSFALLPMLEGGMSETDRLAETGKLAERLMAGEISLFQVVERLLEKNPGEEQLLLVIDQFEELYTLCPHAEVQRGFIDELLRAVEQAGARQVSSLVVLLTMRADFMGQALAHRAFADALQEASMLMGPMTREELRAAIKKPAEVQGAAFEPGLVERILDDVGDEPGNLPLLEFTLTLLWEAHDQGWLTHAAYEGLGCVEGALASYADEVYERLDQGQRQAAHRIFVQLVRPGEGTQDTRRLATCQELGEENRGLVQHLADKRLVVTGRDAAGDESVEVVHEALIQSWGRLQGWMQADRAFRTWQERLRANLRGWQRSQRDEGALLRGAPLAEAQGWSEERGDELSPGELSYIQASLDLRDRRVRVRETRRRQVVFGLTVGLVVALLLAALAGWGWQQADEASKARATAQVKAEISERKALHSERESFARELAAAALNLLSVDQELSILLALQAIDTTYALNGTILPEAETVLHQAVSSSHLLLTLARLGWHDGGVFDLTFSPDGTHLATATNDGIITFWDAASGREASEVWVTGANVAHGLAYSPKGDLLATADIRLWATDTNRVVKELCCLPSSNKIIFGPDGKRLAAVGPEGVIVVWDIDSGEVLFTLRGNSRVTRDVAFSPDGDKLATSTDRIGLIMSATDGEMDLKLYGHTSNIWGVVFSPDGKTLATASADGTVRVWEVLTGQQLLVLAGHAGQVMDVAFSPDGKRLATGGEDGTARIWDLASGVQMFLLAGHSGRINALTFSPDGTRLATASQDGTAMIWDVNPDQELISYAYGTVYDMALSPDGTRLATTNCKGTATLWDTLNGRAVLTLSDQDPSQYPVCPEFASTFRDVYGARLASGVAFSPDGDQLVTTGSDLAIYVWDTTTGQQIHRLDMSKSADAVTFSPDGRLIAVAAPTDTTLWDASTGEELAKYIEEDNILAVFSPDSSLLVTVNKNGTVAIREALSKLESMYLTGYPTTYAAFSPDGRRLATAGLDGVARIWNLENGQEILAMSSHTNAINSLAYSRDGTRLATASDDGTTKVWDPDTGELLHNISTYPVGVGRVLFSPDGSRLITANWDGTVREYLLDINELIELARSRLTRSFTETECQQYLHLEGCPAAP